MAHEARGPNDQCKTNRRIANAHHSTYPAPAGRARVAQNALPQACSRRTRCSRQTRSVPNVAETLGHSGTRRARMTFPGRPDYPAVWRLGRERPMEAWCDLDALGDFVYTPYRCMSVERGGSFAEQKIIRRRPAATRTRSPSICGVDALSKLHRYEGQWRSSSDRCTS